MRKYLLTAALAVLAACTPKTGYVVPQPQDVVMYQVNPRVFAPQDSFKEVAKHLDEIRDLGVNVVWFMPIYEVGQERSVNSPYCIKDYCAVNPEFGTVEDFRLLVDECHKRGMAVIADWVANHTSWDNAWVCEHPEWYTQDEEGKIISPEGTGWLDVADLNFDNAEMRQAMIDAMMFWVDETGIDGFRCDAADFVPFEFWKQMCDAMKALPKRVLLLAEGARKDHFDAGFEMNYAWAYLANVRRVYRRGNSAASLFDVDAAEYEGVPEGCVKLRFTTNHDEGVKMSPIREFGGVRGSMSAFVASTFIRGGALVYDSQEVGYEGSIDFFKYVPVDWTAGQALRDEYTQLLSIYNAHPAIRKGEIVAHPHDDVLMFEKKFQGERILVVVNVRGDLMIVKGGRPIQSTGMPEEAQDYSVKEESYMPENGGAACIALPEDWAGAVVTDLMSGEKIALGSELELEGFEYKIFAL